MLLDNLVNIIRIAKNARNFTLGVVFEPLKIVRYFYNLKPPHFCILDKI